VEISGAITSIPGGVGGFSYGTQPGGKILKGKLSRARRNKPIGRTTDQEKGQQNKRQSVWI